MVTVDVMVIQDHVVCQVLLVQEVHLESQACLEARDTGVFKVLVESRVNKVNPEPRVRRETRVPRAPVVHWVLAVPLVNADATVSQDRLVLEASTVFPVPLAPTVPSVHQDHPASQEPQDRRETEAQADPRATEDSRAHVVRTVPQVFQATPASRVPRVWTVPQERRVAVERTVPQALQASQDPVVLQVWLVPRAQLVSRAKLVHQVRPEREEREDPRVPQEAQAREVHQDSQANQEREVAEELQELQVHQVHQAKEVPQVTVVCPVLMVQPVPRAQ